MNKVGIYYAYWTHHWGVDFIPFISKVKILGFDQLEVNAGTVARMSKNERKKLKDAAFSEGIDLSFCIGMTKDYDLASPDKNTRQKGVEFLKRMAEAVQETGGPGKVLGGILYSCWPSNLPEGETDKTPFLERSVSSMRAAAKAAHDNDVTFCLEVVNRFEQFLLNTAEEASQYVDLIGSNHVKIMLDTFHMNIEEDSFHHAIVTAGSKLGHFHIGETNRKAPGRGKIPWGEIFDTLKEINYPGAIVMEPFLLPGGEVGRDIKIYRDLSIGIDLDAEAARAACFVKDML